MANVLPGDYGGRTRGSRLLPLPNPQQGLRRVRRRSRVGPVGLSTHRAGGVRGMLQQMQMRGHELGPAFGGGPIHLPGPPGLEGGPVHAPPQPTDGGAPQLGGPPEQQGGQPWWEQLGIPHDLSNYPQSGFDVPMDPNGIRGVGGLHDNVVDPAEEGVHGLRDRLLRSVMPQRHHVSAVPGHSMVRSALAGRRAHPRPGVRSVLPTAPGMRARHARHPY